MNKFTCMILLAIIGCALAQPIVQDLEELKGIHIDYEANEETDSQASVVPTDDQETARLKPNFSIFKDYCISARDKTTVFLQNSANTAALKVFETVFNAVGDIGNAALNAHKNSVTSGSEKIMKAENPMMEKIRNVTGDLVFTVIRAAADEFFVKLDEIKEIFTVDQVVDQVTLGCASIERLATDLNTMLNGVRTEIRRSASGNQEVLLNLRAASTGNLGCVTPARVNKINNACNILKLAGPSIYNALGWGQGQQDDF